MSIPKPPRPANASELGSGTGAIVSLTVKLPCCNPAGKKGVVGKGGPLPCVTPV